jgi:hypothetical protein
MYINYDGINNNNRQSYIPSLQFLFYNTSTMNILMLFSTLPYLHALGITFNLLQYLSQRHAIHLITSNRTRHSLF